MIRNRPWKKWTDMNKIMVLASDNVIWSVREATNAPNNLFMRLAVRSVKWRKQNLTGAQYKRERYNDAVEFLQTAFSRWWRWWRWWYHGVQYEDKDEGHDDQTIDKIFVDNQGWGGARSSRVSASSPLFPYSIVWWAPFVFHLFYEVWYCSPYCLYPWFNFLSDPCPIIVLQFVQSHLGSASLSFLPKYLSWSLHWFILHIGSHFHFCMKMVRNVVQHGSWVVEIWRAHVLVQQWASSHIWHQFELHLWNGNEINKNVW